MPNHTWTAAEVAAARGGATHGVVDTSSPILTALGFARYGEERILEQPLE